MNILVLKNIFINVCIYHFSINIFTQTKKLKLCFQRPCRYPKRFPLRVRREYVMVAWQEHRLVYLYVTCVISLPSSHYWKTDLCSVAPKPQQSQLKKTFSPGLKPHSHFTIFSPGWCHKPGLKITTLVPVGITNRD